MARQECVRCHATTFSTEGPHLCKDLARRLKRQEAQITAVCDLLWEHGVYMKDSTPLAEAIVKKLNHLGVTDD
jgi:cytochrome c551/c552